MYFSLCVLRWKFLAQLMEEGKERLKHHLVQGCPWPLEPAVKTRLIASHTYTHTHTTMWASCDHLASRAGLCCKKMPVFCSSVLPPERECCNHSLPSQTKEKEEGESLFLSLCPKPCEHFGLNLPLVNSVESLAHVIPVQVMSASLCLILVF